MGVLSVDKDLNGELQFKTPFPKFEVFVTAEENPDGPGAVGAQAAADRVGRPSGPRDPLMTRRRTGGECRADQGDHRGADACNYPTRLAIQA